MTRSRVTPWPTQPLLKALNMVDANEIRARKALIILLAAGEEAALAMDVDQLDDALNQLCIEHVGCASKTDTDERIDSFYHGVETALFVAACAKLTDNGSRQS